MELNINKQDELNIKRYKTKVKQILKTVFKCEEIVENLSLSEYYLHMLCGIMPSALACTIFYGRTYK